MKLLIALILTVIGCSKQSPATAGAPSALRMTGSDGHVLVQLAPDDRFLDAAGTEIGRYDPAGSTITIAGTQIALPEVVNGGNDGFTLGVWHVVISPGGDVTFDRQPFGHLEGSFTTTEGQRRARALLVAVAILPRAGSPSVDAGIDAQTAEPPLPPPPPPPPPRHAP